MQVINKGNLGINVRAFIGASSSTIQGEPCILNGDRCFSAYYSPSRDGIYQLDPDELNAFYDSGPFQDVKDSDRLTPELALMRQLKRESELSKRWEKAFQSYAIASYDRLIDEKSIEFMGFSCMKLMQTNFTIGSIASGMGMHLHGLKQIGGVPLWAIECDEAIAHCYAQNHGGKVHVKKVEDVPTEDLEEIDLLIATLSCKNASISKGANRGELQADIASAKATAAIIKAKKPKYFMLENVWLYRNFEGFKLIQSTLDKCGYYFRFYKFNLRDWGIAQSRDRLYLLASREGSFPDPIAPRTKEIGWYEAIADLIDQLPETTLAPWQQKKFPELATLTNSYLIPDHSNWTNLVSPAAPASTVRAGHQTFKALIKRCGGGRDSDRLYSDDEPAFAIRAMGRNCDHHSRIADAVVGDKVVAVTPRACLRFFGDKETTDSIWLPSTKSLACEVVGNGASWVMFRELFERLVASDTQLHSTESNSLRSGGEMFKVSDRVEFLYQAPLGFKGIENKVDNDSHSLPCTPVPQLKESDKWYTPPNIEDSIIQVLGAIDLDPCADDGKHIAAARHYTAADDGLSQQWHGRVFMNPPYSCPGKWIAKLQTEIESGRVTEAIALVPASTDTKWLSPLLESQPVCFWKVRIKFLDTNYQPKQSARQSHCLVYWGDNWQRFKEVFDPFGVVKMPDGKWNPSDFGNLLYKTDGDQLTIFCDYNEPPEPDDYPDIPTYERDWAEWEKKLHPMPNAQCPMPNAQCPMTNDSYQPKDKTMTTFQFSATSAIANQIAQLQEQLNQLTASLKPYQECEQKAEDLRRQIAQYGSEMTNKGIPQSDILKWGKSLYSAASGVEFVEADNGVIAAQNEAIAELKTELEKAKAQRNEAFMQLDAIARERDEALNKIENITEEKLLIARRLQTTQDRHAQVLQELKDLKEQPTSSTQYDTTRTIVDSRQILSPGDRVQVIDVSYDINLRHLFGNKGTILKIEEDAVTVLFETTAILDQREATLPLHCLELASDKLKVVEAVPHPDVPHPDIQAQIKGREFIASIKTKSGMNNLTWQNISVVCQQNPVILREMVHSASTKLQKEFTNIDNLARLLSEYILETGDITDFGWLDQTFVAKVEALVEGKKSLPYHKGDWVRETETGKIWQIRTSDDHWLSVIADNKITSLHKSEVELVQQEVAA